MAKPIVHARSSARRFGGVAEDYLEIHDLMDSSKSAFPDNRHRALTHNSWFFFIVERIFGHEIDLTCSGCGGSGSSSSDITQMGVIVTKICSMCNGSGSAGKASVRAVCEQHVLEDFRGRFIPTVADYFEGMEFQDWMNNGIEGTPSSHRKIDTLNKETKRRSVTLD